MEIKLNKKYSYELVYEAENVKVVENATERVKIISLGMIGNDIKDETIQKFACILSELITHRSNPIDTGGLIEELFIQLPEGIRENLLKTLNENYG